MARSRTMEQTRECREGTTGTKTVTSSARRGALAMWDVAAWITYHSAPANVNIAPCDTVAQPPATTGYATSEPCLCASFAVTGEVTGNCSTVAC